WLKTLYRKRAVTWPFIFYTIIWTLSNKSKIIKSICLTHPLELFLYIPFYSPLFNKINCITCFLS
ncbi:hypothetical protein FVD74_04465, partial [Enterococcus faecium]|nr:hypothetical protein [Enterococcus faecium]